MSKHRERHKFPISLGEADYLVAILNSSIANLAIKPFQSMGLMGERDIHKKLLDLPIPEYGFHKAKHLELAHLGTLARERACQLLKSGDFPTFLTKQRGWVCEQLDDIFKKIDQITIQILDLA